MKKCKNCKFHNNSNDECEYLSDTYMVRFQTEGEEKWGEYETFVDYQRVVGVYTDEEFGCVLWTEEEK